jgi:disulfide bond formation protein DsbB
LYRRIPLEFYGSMSRRKVQLMMNLDVIVFFICIILYQVTKTEGDQECKESSQRGIPLCQPGACCRQLPFSYSCHWRRGNLRRHKSPYVSVYRNQSDIPLTWDLPVERPQLVNECEESHRMNVSLCRPWAICTDQPRGYMCKATTSLRGSTESPYYAEKCDQQELNWTCPSPEQLSNSTYERLKEAIDKEYVAKQNATSESLETLQRNLNESMQISNFALKTTANTTKKANQFFNMSMSLVQMSVENIAMKFQTSSNTSLNVSLTVGALSVRVQAIEPGERKSIYRFPGTRDTVILEVDRKHNLADEVVASFTSVKSDMPLLHVLKDPQGKKHIISNIIGGMVYEDTEINLTVKLEHSKSEDSFKPSYKEDPNLFRKFFYYISWKREDSFKPSYKEDPNIFSKFFYYISWKREKEETFEYLCGTIEANQTAEINSMRTDTCEKLSSSSINETHCKCRNVRRFMHVAALLHITSTDLGNVYALHILTMIACVICIVCYKMVCVALLLMKASGIRFIQLYLCLGLLLGNVSFFIGMLIRDSLEACLAFVPITHYFFLLSFTWKLIYGNSLRLTVKNINPVHESSKRKIKLILMGFSIPAVIVIITIGVDFEGYFGAMEGCWISNSKYSRLSFVIPLLVVLVWNAFNLCMIGYHLYEHKKTLSKMNTTVRRNQYMLLMKASLTMGFMWISGLLVNIPKIGFIFAYIFPITNGLQGILFFWHVFITSKDVRNELSRFTRRYLSPKGTFSSSKISQSLFDGSKQLSNIKSRKEAAVGKFVFVEPRRLDDTNEGSVTFIQK